MKDFCEINDLVESVECRMQDAYEQGYETGHKDGEARGIDKMNNLSKEAYAKGLEDAWECVRKIILGIPLGGIHASVLLEMFGTSSADEILENVDVDEAMQKIKEYEEQQKQKCESCFTEKLTKEKWASAKDCKECKHFTDADEVHGYTPCGSCGADLYNFEPKQTDAPEINVGSIKVGDEIYSDETDMTAVVHHIDAWGRYQCFNSNGAQFILDKETYGKYWHKTYKYYPQIAEVLEQLKNG